MMIYNFLFKIPAGTMVVPLLLGSLFVTFVPDALQIGGITTALFSKVAVNTLLGMQLFCMGTNLRVREVPTVLRRGGTLLIGKFAIGAALGILVGHFFGAAGFLGISSLALVSAVTSHNGSIYLSLMMDYGDEADQGCFPVLAIADGPLLTLVVMGAAGLANIPFISLIAAVIPIIIGMIIGNLDKKMRDLFAPCGQAIIPLIGFALGTSINMAAIVQGGGSGLILGLINIVIAAPLMILIDRGLNRRPGYAGLATATTAGNQVGTPAIVALADPTLTGIAPVATTQIATSILITAIAVPFLTGWWSRRFGCPQLPAKESQPA